MTEFKYRPRKVASTAVKDKIRAMRSKRGGTLPDGHHKNSMLPVIRRSNGWVARTRYHDRFYVSKVYGTYEEAAAQLPRLAKAVSEMAKPYALK